jgi:hypothetical protein
MLAMFVGCVALRWDKSTSWLVTVEVEWTSLGQTPDTELGGSVDRSLTRRSRHSFLLSWVVSGVGGVKLFHVSSFEGGSLGFIFLTVYTPMLQLLIECSEEQGETLFDHFMEPIMRGHTVKQISSHILTDKRPLNISGMAGACAAKCFQAFFHVFAAS